MEENFYVFRTSDGVDFKLTSRIINMFNYVASHLNEITDNFINLSGIKSQEFQLIVQYCEHHNYVHPPEIVRPLQHNELKKCVNDEWDVSFINSLDFEKVTDLLVAADILKCTSLCDLCYARIALFFRTTPLQDLKKEFLLTENEFTENEIKEIKEGNNWLMSLTEDRIKELDNC